MTHAYTLLSYLLFFDLGGSFFYDYTVDGCYALKIGEQSRMGNKVISDAPPSSYAIAMMTNYFSGTPCAWVVDDADISANVILQDHGLKNIFTGSGMILDLAELPVVDIPHGLAIKKVTGEDELQIFFSIVAETFHHKIDHQETVARYLLEHAAPDAVHCYLGFYRGQAIAAGMAIYHDATASLHWIGTLPAYRKQGIGTAMSCQPLIDARDHGCTNAILCSTSAGKSMYERIGFRQYATYNFYGLS